MSKKLEVFRQYFEFELGRHKTMSETFKTANRKFEDEKGINGYSSYESFLNCIRNKKK